jgi:hypothetical protein
MPIGPQPAGRRGTVGHPYSALNLRLALALGGLALSAALGALALAAGHPVAGWALLVLAAVAAVDAVVVQARRRARRRAGGAPGSLFE